VNENESLFPNPIDLGDLRRSVSAGHLRSGIDNLSTGVHYPGNGNDSRPIIIVQRCCGGHSSARSCRSDASAAATSDKRHHLNPEQARDQKAKSSRKKHKQVDLIFVKEHVVFPPKPFLNL
jgi:hypothetical protein